MNVTVLSFYNYISHIGSFRRTVSDRRNLRYRKKKNGIWKATYKFEKKLEAKCSVYLRSLCCFTSCLFLLSFLLLLLLLSFRWWKRSLFEKRLSNKNKSYVIFGIRKSAPAPPPPESPGILPPPPQPKTAPEIPTGKLRHSSVLFSVNNKE